MKTLLISLVTVALTMLLGCGPGALYPGSQLAPDESAAMGRIAYTRLAREQACRPRVGGSVESVNVEGRMTLLRSATEAEIKPSSCKSNIHPRQLDDCISEIRHWPCDVNLMNVALIESCKAQPLCGVPAQDGTL